MKLLLRIRQASAEIRNIVFGTLRLKSKEQDLDEEIQFHLEERIEELVHSGHSVEQARRIARKEFGNIDRCREECRDSWGNRVVTNSIQDLKFSIRSLARTKGYCLTIIGTIALCVAAHTVSFTALYNLFLEPPPFRDSDRLVEIYNTMPLISQPKRPVSIHQYLAFRKEAESFEELALWFAWTFNVGEDSSATRGIGAQVTASYFRLLDIEPLLGSFFTDEDCKQGRVDLVVLTQTCWENRYGADPDIVGTQIELSGSNVTVVGVAPRKLEAMNADNIMLRPYSWSEAEASAQQHFRFRPILYGRLRPNVSMQQAVAQLNTIENNYVQSVPQRSSLEKMREEAGHEIVAGAIRAEQTKGVRDGLFLIQTAAVLVIALGCANISNLVLNRFNARLSELSTRLSLGANRRTLIRQLILEGLILAVPGAALGVVLASSTFSYLNKILSELVREAQPIAIDGTILLSALIIGGIIITVSTIAPLSQLAKFKLGSIGQPQTRLSTSGAKSRRFSNVLVVIQFAIAAVVLIGASLLLRSFQKTMEIDPGYDTEQVVYFRTARNITSSDEKDWPAIEGQILEKLRSIPGIESVSYSSYNPVNPRLGASQFPLRGEDNSDSSTLPLTYAIGVSPEYFQTMGIPILSGRSFEESDYSGNPFQHYIVDASFAKKYAKGGDIVGRAVELGPQDDPPEKWRTIIGVAKTVSVTSLDNQETLPVVYYLQPKQQPGLSVEMRTRLSTKATLDLARNALSEIDPTLPMYHQGSIQHFFDESLGGRKAITSFVSVFAAIGLLLSAIGIYGVLSYDVTKRVREIGIRGALGASSREIVSLFVRQGLSKALVGVTIGIAMALALARFTRSFLFQIEPTDTVSFILAPVLLFSIALFASWIPARRAARLDPVASLRSD